MIDKKLLWEETIHEIKVDGIREGFSFRLGQVLKIRPFGFNGDEVKRIVSDIVREKIDGEIVYQVITTDMNNENHAVTKVFIGLPVYITFQV